MNNPSLVETIRERIKNLTRDRNRYLHPDDQARLSWAREAKTIEELPEIYRGFFDTLPEKDKEPFPYSVISPTFKGFLQPENEKLICRVGECLCVLEQKNGKLTARRYPHSEIYLIETGTILLYSWFAVHGTDSAGGTAPTTIKFNSITEHLYAPFVEWFRGSIQPAGKNAKPAAEASPFADLADVNFKFMNFALKTISPGEPVLQVLLQPEIRKTAFAFLGCTLARRIAPAHLAILTERDLVLIRDDPSQRERSKTPYGGIWNYIPLRKIQSVALAPGEDGRTELSVHLPDDRRVDLSYAETKRPEAEKLRRRILENNRG
ncbi:MAG: hypothetical protein JW748_13600 [Anaerolineales bacterium]|nr:hypothetical protein [Anaerolineales bacterium]